MGQKVNPNGFRYGITKKHETTWFADKAKFADYLLEDERIRRFLGKFTREYQIGQIEIARNQANDVNVTVHSARPALIIGEAGANLQRLVTDIKKTVANRSLKLTLQVQVIEKPELNARLLAEAIAIKLENRAPYRTAQRQAIRDALKAGAKGIKTVVSGRLNGVDIARTEGYTEGEMKLHTLRQDIEFAKATAWTTYGSIGVKVWISKGEIFDGKEVKANATTETNEI